MDDVTAVRTCPCGGTFRSIGKHALRLGEDSALGTAWGSLQTLGVELFACDRCRELKLFLPETPRCLMEDPDGPLVEQCKEDLADFPAKKLRQIAENGTYDRIRRRAARELLAERSGREDG